jgi:hypothetical protein
LTVCLPGRRTKPRLTFGWYFYLFSLSLFPCPCGHEDSLSSDLNATENSFLIQGVFEASPVFRAFGRAFGQLRIIPSAVRAAVSRTPRSGAASSTSVGGKRRPAVPRAPEVGPRLWFGPFDHGASPSKVSAGSRSCSGSFEFCTPCGPSSRHGWLKFGYTKM